MQSDAQTEARAIQRYIAPSAGRGAVVQLLKHCDGEWVRYEEHATALSDQVARIAALEAELIQSRNFWSDELSAVSTQLTASRAECEGLRAAIRALLDCPDIADNDYKDEETHAAERTARAYLSQPAKGAEGEQS